MVGWVGLELGISVFSKFNNSVILCHAASEIPTQDQDATQDLKQTPSCSGAAVWGDVRHLFSAVTHFSLAKRKVTDQCIQRNG